MLEKPIMECGCAANAILNIGLLIGVIGLGLIIWPINGGANNAYLVFARSVLGGTCFAIGLSMLFYWPIYTRIVSDWFGAQ